MLHSIFKKFSANYNALLGISFELDVHVRFLSMQMFDSSPSSYLTSNASYRENHCSDDLGPRSYCLDIEVIPSKEFFLPTFCFRYIIVNEYLDKHLDKPGLNACVCLYVMFSPTGTNRNRSQ